MSTFVCKKPITLSGRNFSYGEVIPDGFVLPKRALTLIRSGYVAEIDGTMPVEVTAVQNEPSQQQNDETLITIPVTTENGSLELTISSQDVITVFTILQKTVEEAVKDIAMLENKDVLILLDAADSRKGIKKAAEERHMQLAEGASKPDNAGGATPDTDGKPDDGNEDSPETDGKPDNAEGGEGVGDD